MADGQVLDGAGLEVEYSSFASQVPSASAQPDIFRNDFPPYAKAGKVLGHFAFQAGFRQHLVLSTGLRQQQNYPLLTISPDLEMYGAERNDHAFSKIASAISTDFAPSTIQDGGRLEIWRDE